MENLPNDVWLQFRDDTLHQVRELFNLHKPGQMNESIDLLQDWIKKQPHFKKKNYERHYLERYIIRAKGSVQKAKQRFEAMCILRTALAEYYAEFKKPNQVKGLENVEEVLMPKQTDKYYTIYLMRNKETSYGEDWVKRYFTRGVKLLEFFSFLDYNAGYIAIIDYRESDIIKIISTMANPALIKPITLLLKAYGSRINSVHIIINSSLLETGVHLFKPVMGDKIQRLMIHRSLESLYKYVDKDLLPADYGGKEEPLSILSKKMIDVASSKEIMKTLEEFSKGTIDTKIKPVSEAVTNDTGLGVSGTFRSLALD